MIMIMIMIMIIITITITITSIPSPPPPLSFHIDIAGVASHLFASTRPSISRHNWSWTRSTSSAARCRWTLGVARCCCPSPSSGTWRISEGRRRCWRCWVTFWSGHRNRWMEMEILWWLYDDLCFFVLGDILILVGFRWFRLALLWLPGRTKTICSGHCFGLGLLIWSSVDCLDHEFHEKKSLKNQQIFPANRRLSRWIWWVVLYLRIWRSCLWSVTTGCGWSTRRCCGSFKCRRRRWRRSRVRQKWWPGVERDDGDGRRWEIRIWNWVKRTNQGLLWGNIYRNPLFLIWPTNIMGSPRMDGWTQTFCWNFVGWELIPGTCETIWGPFDPPNS